ncbi:zinc transporter ZIP11 [Aplysia californica]|uniref:Zinc transporter ZIP11 n=1 Tax=Aplysia californica TaxID=6500 RepID=A0ABM0K4S8_APLCA|nr:zinc transporter ZIP11 [Aplysia californica]
MIESAHPLLQTLLGTLFTWGLTALGAGLVFVFQSGQRKILDGSLGFAAGVMTAASYWSLLAPAIEMAEGSGLYGSEGQWAFVPVAIGFTLGAVFVYGADVLLPSSGNMLNPSSSLALSVEDRPKYEGSESILLTVQEDMVGSSGAKPRLNQADTRQRRTAGSPSALDARYHEKNGLSSAPARLENSDSKAVSWRRILLLIIAITIHNIPEGLAVGVGFGAVGKTKAATFENARNLAFGIGIQNFPEGLAVSLPLRGSGMSTMKSFWYGQLSGMVEPIAGLLGAFAVFVAEPILPYALAFAAGAMIYVVVDDIIPEAQTSGNGKLASWGAVVGFVIMMSLDVGLG